MDSQPNPIGATATLLAEVEGVRRLARCLVHDAADADDIAQDAIRVALESPPRSGWPLGAFLRGVVRRLARNRHVRDD